MILCTSGSYCPICSKAPLYLRNSPRYSDALELGLDPHSSDVSFAYPCRDCGESIYETFWTFVRGSSRCPSCGIMEVTVQVQNLLPGTPFKAERSLDTVSKTETYVLSELRKIGLNPIEAQAIKVNAPFYGKMYVVPDALFPNKVALEVDSPGAPWADSHMGLGNTEKDLRKTSLLASVGWKVVRFRLGGLPKIAKCANVCMSGTFVRHEDIKDLSIALLKAQLGYPYEQ